MTFKQIKKIAGDPVTAGLDLAGDLITLTESLSPDIHELIKASLPAFEQSKMTMRMRRCKRFCRRNHFTQEQVISQVNILFQDVKTLIPDIEKCMIGMLFNK